MKMLALMLGMLATTSGGCAAKWELVWSDEFDYRGLPDPAKWGYEEGFVRNRESQYYTRARLENARVEEGMLVIECRKEQYTPERLGRPVEYTAASLITRNKASWRYGRIEVRAKLPRGKGVWPAIWTLGEGRGRTRWPACGEIDIMEFIGKAPNEIHGGVHYAGDGKHCADGGKIETDRPYDDFHIYAIDWYPDRIEFYFDTLLRRTVLLDQAGQGENNCFRKPHYLLLNFALGGSWGGPFDDSILPQKFLIDYVRIYKQKDAPPSAQPAADKPPR